MLKFVEVRNFRSCFNTNFGFDGGFSAICGRNGVGKTNVLRAINWACISLTKSERVSLHEIGSAANEIDQVSVKLHLNFDDNKYIYELGSPTVGRRDFGFDGSSNSGLSESLTCWHTDGKKQDVFSRISENIKIPDRQIIRMPRWTPALAALNSLLALDDPHRIHIDRVMKFFSNVKYYSLDEKSDPSPYVTESRYAEWKDRYESERILTDSVAFRLIYMFYEKRELFDEFAMIVGPNGLGLIDRLDVIELTQPEPDSGKDDIKSENRIFVPLFEPSSKMGGYGRRFTFSDLSLGTRRVIRIIASLVFDERSLMLIEQPEDSVHFGLLRKLIGQLRSYSYKSQILMTTHSLEVLDILRPEEILIASAIEGYTDVRKLSSDELQRAKRFIKNDGTHSEFLETVDEFLG